jgi:periplasmic divalent cation tolerance protein
MVLVKSTPTPFSGASHSFKLWRAAGICGNGVCTGGWPPLTEFIQISTAVNSKESANKIARKLLGERVAACVQVLGPIQSHYWWRGRIELAKEWICFIKSRASDYPRIEASIRKVHPYDVPEILALPVLLGNTDYLRWIRNETAPKSKRGTMLDRA